MRSGAFAPDYPCVILVRLRLPTDSLGLIDAPRPARPRSDRLGRSIFPAVGASRLLGVLARTWVWWRVLRCPPQVGRAGGLLGLTRCLASKDDAARWCESPSYFSYCAPAGSRSESSHRRPRMTQDTAYAPGGRPRGRPGAGPARSFAKPRRGGEYPAQAFRPGTREDGCNGARCSGGLRDAGRR